MPEGNPVVGEVWEMKDTNGRLVRGVVSELAPNVNTLVSFTGIRARVTPDSMLGSWRFSQSPPPTALRCNRRGCTQSGILRFQRGTRPEWVCPRHLPVGVQASLTTESLGMPETPQAVAVVSSQCPGCQHGIEPIEDLRLATADVQVWHCPGCNTRWGSLSQQPGWSEGETLRQAITGFQSHMQARSMNITYTETTKEVYDTLVTFLAQSETNPVGWPPPIYTFSGVPIRQSTGIPEGAAMLFRLRGAPIFREVAAQPSVAVAQWTRVGATPGNGVAEATARALHMARDERAQQPAALSPSDTLMNAMVEAAANSEVMVVYSTAPGRFGTDEEVSWVKEQIATPFVAVGQRWTMAGSVVEVTRVSETADKSATMVHFRRTSEGAEASAGLVLEDFVRECRPLVQKSSDSASVPISVALKDEEWEHISSGEVVVIDSLDTKRDLVIVMSKEGKRRSIPTRDFITAKWRKIVRRTAYDRLLDLEDD